MDTPTPPLSHDNDPRSIDQQERDAAARLNPNDPAVTATSPDYGSFGHASAATAAAPGRSGANDNPDEFSEFSDREKEAQNAPNNPEDQPGHIMQNQAPELVHEVQAEGGDNTELREAWAKDDPRYAGGGTHNTREESADTDYPAKDE
ncbi:hypothetical protein [Hymenobacter siberiensis]|uniref:hypothetical protein n=1 Tax=Hymenobacter siberiensis TaxID=2848396 RepID=UPI001C1E6209|nr:hypothetical protein [Hymenobacter siberiensis]